MSGTAVGQAWIFARVGEFLERYQPLTPWGKDEAQSHAILVDRDAIESRYDDIDAAISWIRDSAGDPLSHDRASYHLKRMPRIPQAARDSYELVELYQVKKFIANYRGTLAAIGGRMAGMFGLDPLGAETALGVLALELARGGPDAETLYIADAYDAGLADARSGMAGSDAAIAAERSVAESLAAKEFGVSFDGREFVVVPREAALAMAGSGGRYSAEPYDEARYVVRILPSPAALEAMGARAAFQDLESMAEARVTARLSAMVRDALPGLSRAVAAVTRWDRARAGAVLALGFGMRRPDLGSGAIILESARFVPCEDECLRLGLAYTPLSARFGKGAVVLFGSNMGGKTVVLQTVLFFQLLAQAGLFVPAAGFGTRVYQRVEYVGERSQERLEGLSGFGLEVWRLGATWSHGEGRKQGATLVAFDELARTTGSHEAEALLSAVVEAYAGTGHALPGLEGPGQPDTAFFATHFRGIARLPGVEYRRMRGLDRIAAADLLRAGEPGRGARPSGSDASGGRLPAERLAGINRCMRYEIVDDDGSSTESDALAIASLLGLDEAIVGRARWFMSKDGV